jgi:hypothetical protein
MGALVGYVVLLPWAGYHTTSTLVTLIVLRVMGVKSWGVSLGTALALAFLSYYALAVLLHVPLPLGAWVEALRP